MNPALKVTYGCLKNESITYLLPNTVNKIGRNPLTNTIILNHHSISKEHALIEFDIIVLSLVYEFESVI